MLSHAFGLLALAASTLAAPQAVTAIIDPPTPAPSGCASSHSGTFEITVVNVTWSAKVKRDVLTLTLASGTLKDAAGRTGYVASNYQFQFDGPPQAGAIYTAGFSVCGNGSLALGGSAIWWQCLSGGFYNLYDRNWAPQCSPIYIDVIGGAAAGAATQSADGQPGVTTQVPQMSDGQVYATVSQISDGQVQAVTQIADGQIQGQAVTQITDGQVQAPKSSAAAVGQISDGQIQATTAKSTSKSTSKSAVAVSQMSDGQVVATSTKAAPVSQISDGQIQATTAAAAPVTKTSASTHATSTASVTQTRATSSAVVAVASATSSAPLQVHTNAANALTGENVAVVAGLAAMIALL